MLLGCNHCPDGLSITISSAYPLKPRRATKIRNELSHKRGINIIETHNLARANVDRFECIVRKYIFDK